MCKFLKILLNILVVFDTILCVVLLCVLCPRFVEYCDRDLGFDYIGVIIGILALLVTLLIGWNIYQLVDLKSKSKDIDKLRTQIERELNYIHNKADYNQAVVYGMMSVNASIHFAPNEDDVVKHQMILKGIMALKILANFPDCKIEIEKISEILIKGLKNSEHISLSEKMKTDLLLMCGGITNTDKVSCYDEIVELIEKIPNK